MVADGLEVGFAQRLRITDLHVTDLTDLSALDNLLHLLEVRQITAIVGHKTRDACLFGDAVDTGTIVVTGRQRLLDIDGLASLHRHDGKGGVAGGRCGDIDGVHVGIIDELLRIGVPLTDAMLDSIGTSSLLRAAHHRHDTRASHLAESRTALLLCHFTTADEAPS